jgi:hypothetical protein
MKSPAEKIAVAHSGLKLTAAMRAGLGLLLQAHDTSLSLSCDKWDFAFEIQALKESTLFPGPSPEKVAPAGQLKDYRVLHSFSTALFGETDAGPL